MDPKDNLSAGLDYLRELTSDDEATLRDLVGVYLNETAEGLEKLKVAIQSGVAKDVYPIVHSMVGSSQVYGMKALASCLYELERQSREGNLADAPRLLARALNEFVRVQTFLELNLKAA